MSGWVKLHRCLADKPIWQESTPEQKTILITLLMMANHQEKEWEWKGERYKAEPGQFVTSLPSIVKKCGKGITIQNVRTALKRFEKYEFLTDEATNRNRLITIVNWGGYQGCEDEANSQTNRQLTGNQQATNRQLTANKNVKNDKNEKKINPLTPLDINLETELNTRSFSLATQEKLREWIQYKKEKRQAYKPTGLKSFCSVVERKIMEHGENAVLGLIDESMGANWQGVPWDKLKPQAGPKKKSSNPFADMARRMEADERNRNS
jgi:hypothetical protein